VSGQTQEPPTIDTVVVMREPVFPGERSQLTFLERVMNAFHVKTRPWVITNELLFEAGQPLDSAVLAESERILRSKEIFNQVVIDTARIDGRLATVVRTQDGWSTKPNIGFAVATDGTWTGQFGITETNVIGTGNMAHAAWVKETDREGPEVIGRFQRFFSTQLEAAGSVNFWDDGTDGFWHFGDPWRSTADRVHVLYDGQAVQRRVLQYRVENFDSPDTTFYHHRALINYLTGATVATATPYRYVRIGARVGYRREQFIALADTAAGVPDSTYGEFAVFGEFRKARYRAVQYFNGFTEEDVDVSDRVALTLNVAAAGLGYTRFGIGPRIEAALGTYGDRWLVVGVLKANGLFTDAGLDSGRVIAEVTVGVKPAQRHSTVLQVQAGAQENPPPGEEFDLGFTGPPRSWEPHSFVGTRTLWGTLEHRWFALDAVLGFLAVGFAGFLDYGGAWYPDQDPRFGGNIGIGLRLGSALSSAARTGRIDFGCRVGNGSEFGRRCVITLGGGFVFPWSPEAGKLLTKTKH
jgi:hypothetical protein